MLRSLRSKGHTKESKDKTHTTKDEKRKKTEIDKIKVVAMTEGDLRRGRKERISSKSKGHNNQENRDMKHTINDEKKKENRNRRNKKCDKD